MYATHLWATLAVVSLVLQVLVIHELLRGAYRRFPILLGYCSVLLFISVFNTLAFFQGPRGEWTKHSQQYYWIGEMILQGIIYVIVISFVHRAMGANSNREATRRRLIACAAVIAAAAFYFFHDARTAVWMTRVTLYLSFLSTLFSLLLWVVLIRVELRDRMLLLVTGGLGMQMAGQAIGHALREVARPGANSQLLVFAGNLSLVLSHLICLYVWWRAFRDDNSARAF
jgi:hypothetical protein